LKKIFCLAGKFNLQLW